MAWHAIDNWMVLIAALCAGACALPGCFLVLKRMSMMGDAISHAVLPGLALAFILTGSRASMAMFVGAAVAGVLTALFTQWIGRMGRVDGGASMGIVFTTLFAIGLLLIVQAADHVDLDPSCVLYGALELAPLDLTDAVMLAGFRLPLPGGLMIPRTVLTLSGVMLGNLLVILLCYKEFRISAFDPDLATTLGIPAGLMHYLLMVMTAITAVAAFEAVGSIIVIAMLIVPAATARLLTNRLGVMLALSVLLGGFAAVLGHVGAVFIPPLLGFPGTSTAGMTATASGLLFLLAWGRHGRGG